MKKKLLPLLVGMCLLGIFSGCELESDDTELQGTISFYVTNEMTTLPVKIWVDDKYVGQINTHLNYTPSECGATGSVTVTVKSANLRHHWKAEHHDGTVRENWANVPADGCRVVTL